MSGQITPFLLVIMVILLIAAIATVNIGRVALDKTCSANAADAGSLAAASAWASAFNALTKMNYDRMFVYGDYWFGIKTWFDVNYYTYGQIYYESDKYIDEAIVYAGAASAAAAASLAFATVPPYCNYFWYEGVMAAVFDMTASVLSFEASQSVASFTITLQFMQSQTDLFYNQQWKNYCDAAAFMDSSYIGSRKTGLSYAFSNSCISAKLSSVQSDAFSAWISSETAYGDISQPLDGTAYEIVDGKLKRTCNWRDKVPQQHTVSADLDLPNIDSYELKHTAGSYSEINDLLGRLITRSQLISGVLNGTAVALATTAVSFLAVFAVSVVTFSLFPCASVWPYACYKAWWASCLRQWALYEKVLPTQAIVIVPALAGIVALAGAGSVYLLKDDNDKAFGYWAPDGIQSIKGTPCLKTSLTCEPCKNEKPEDYLACQSCQDAEDLMIVKIAEIKLAGQPHYNWSTTSRATQIHPATSTGIIPTTYPTIISQSRARFDGCDKTINPPGCGDVGAVEPKAPLGDTYDPSIEWTS